LQVGDTKPFWLGAKVEHDQQPTLICLANVSHQLIVQRQRGKFSDRQSRLRAAELDQATVKSQDRSRAGALQGDVHSLVIVRDREPRRAPGEAGMLVTAPLHRRSLRVTA